MKTVKFLLLSASIILSIDSVKSQSVVPNSEYMLDKLRLNKVMNGINYETYETMEGDPFIYRNFREGELTLLNHETFRLEMRYDIYADQLQLRSNSNIFAINYPEKLASVVLDSLKLIYSKYAKSPGKENSAGGSYFILKEDGRCKLLIRKNIRVQEAELPKILQEAKPAKFIHLADTYYLKFDENDAIKIAGKKEFVSQFGEKQEEIDSFIIKNKLKIKSEEDLIRIVSFYNSNQ